MNKYINETISLIAFRTPMGSDYSLRTPHIVVPGEETAPYNPRPMASTPALERRTDRLLREDYFVARLPSGMEIYGFPRPGMKRKVAAIATRYGSIDLDFRPARGVRVRDARGDGGFLRTPPGIAHFLEHQLFKKQGVDMLMEFGRFGASANAFTEHCATTYYFSSTGEFEPALDLLTGFVLHPEFKAENVEKEKDIIEQELRMYQDMPDYRGYQNLMESLYRVHPARIDIGGTVESIRRISRNLLEDCYRVFYHPSNLTVALAGDIDVPALVRRIRDAEGTSPARGDGRIGRAPVVEPPEVERARVDQTMAVSRPKFHFGFKDHARRTPGDYELGREIAAGILLDLMFGRSAPLYNRLYEKGLIDDSFSYSYNAENTFAFTVIAAETDRAAELEEALREGIRAIRRRGALAKRDLERVRRKRVGRYLRTFDTADNLVFAFLGCHLKGEDLFSYPRILKRITRRDLLELLDDLFDEKRAAVSLILPKTA